jgi:hypothetical protein
MNIKKFINCEAHKSPSRDGVIHRCSCAYLNRNASREYMLYKKFMKQLEKK